MGKTIENLMIFLNGVEEIKISILTEEIKCSFIISMFYAECGNGQVLIHSIYGEVMIECNKIEEINTEKYIVKNAEIPMIIEKA